MPPEWNVHDKISTQPGLWMHFPSSQYIELMVCLMLHKTSTLHTFKCCVMHDKDVYFSIDRHLHESTTAWIILIWCLYSIISIIDDAGLLN